MVWSTIFYKPDEWYVVLAWVLGLVFSVWSLYITLSKRAKLKVNRMGFEYKWDKQKIRLKWSDIEYFKLYKSNMLEGTTAASFAYMPLEIGVVYSDTYNDGKLTKLEEDFIEMEGVHCNLPLGTNFNNKHELVDSLNNCVRNKLSPQPSSE
jgi:hypothetical protein